MPMRVRGRIVRDKRSGLMYFAGTAKFKFCPPFTLKVVTPITSPFVFSSTPPLLPGEMAAVVWITGALSNVLIALTTPSETEAYRPLFGDDRDWTPCSSSQREIA
jgi:hypothetical protein